MGFYIGIALVLLVLGALVFAIGRRGGHGTGWKRNLSDGVSLGEEGSRTNGTQWRNAHQSRNAASGSNSFYGGSS